MNSVRMESMEGQTNISLIHNAQLSGIEQTRLDLQNELDQQKTPEERNRLGQFATPTTLAREILAKACRYADQKKIDFLDPAIGTGAFYSALLKTVPAHTIGACRGVEIDPHYAIPARGLWPAIDIHIEIPCTPHPLELNDHAIQNRLSGS